MGINTIGAGVRGQNISVNEADKNRTFQQQQSDLARDLALRQLEQQQGQFDANLDFQNKLQMQQTEQGNDNAIYGALGSLGGGVLSGGLGALGYYLKP